MDILEKYFEKKVWKFIKMHEESITEIRLRVQAPMIINTTEGEYICKDYIPNEQDMELIFNQITNFSAYAYEKELRQGYFTIPGGHRVGLAGEAVIKDGYFTGLKNIRFLNFRICHRIEKFGIDIVLKMVSKQTIKNTLIISRPGYGKTTLLRNLVKYISDNQPGTSITVIDERCEISGAYLGVPQINLGIRTDVLCGVEKQNGILMAVRSMAPKIIAVDEIGGKEDVLALMNAIYCGVKIIATIHGDCLEDVKKRTGAELFDCFEIMFHIAEKGRVHIV